MADVLGFEALYATYAPVSYVVEEFCVVYVVRKSHQDARSLVLRSLCDKLIINLVDNNHG